MENEECENKMGTDYGKFIFFLVDLLFLRGE